MFNAKVGFFLVALLYSATFPYNMPRPIPNAGRKSSYPFISGDTFRNFADFIVDGKVPWNYQKEQFDPNDVKQGDIIYVKTGRLKFFFETLHPNIQEPYILITHNDDGSPFHYSGTITQQLLNSPKLIVWFSQNKSIPLHPKFIGLPIGVANRYWKHGDYESIKKAIALINEPCQRDDKKLVYINFDISSNEKRRRPAWNYFSRQEFSLVAKGKKTFFEYLKEMSRCKFVLSPRGNALDSHRTWEALLLGTIPIVPPTRPEFDELYNDLPIVIVENWKVVTREYLEKKFQEVEQKKKAGFYNIDKVYAEYWFKLIKSYQMPYKQ